MWKHAGLNKIIMEEKASFEIVLQSPFSFIGFNRAIANKVNHSHWDEKQRPENLIELLVHSPNINIRVTEYASNCSLFLTSKYCLYDFYLWAAPTANDRTENNFMALEFERLSNSKDDSYRILEKHYEFLREHSIPLEEFLHSPLENEEYVYGKDFYYLYKSDPELALNRYAKMKEENLKKIMMTKSVHNKKSINWYMQ